MSPEKGKGLRLCRPHCGQCRERMQVGFPLETGPGIRGPRENRLVWGPGNPGQARLEPLCMSELPFGATLGGPGHSPGELASVPPQPDWY